MASIHHHLHPVLICDEIKNLLKAAIVEHRTINFKVGHNYAAPYYMDPIMCKLLLDLAPGPKPYQEFLTGPTAEFIKAAALVSGSGQAVEGWLRMILTRLSDPL